MPKSLRQIVENKKKWPDHYVKKETKRSQDETSKQVKKSGKDDLKRKKKVGLFPYNEETEQLDELSKEKMAKYIPPAADSYASEFGKIQSKFGKEKNTDQDLKMFKDATNKFINRKRGIKGAADRLSGTLNGKTYYGEETEQLDEISKTKVYMASDKLATDLKKTHAKAKKLDYTPYDKMTPEISSELDKTMKHMDKRYKQVDTFRKKTAGEDWQHNKVKVPATGHDARFDFIGRQIRADYAKTDAKIARNKAKLGKRRVREETELNEVDTISLTVPLFIRMLEYAKEDAKTDMDLHKATENLMAIDGVVDMDSYEDIVDV